MGHSRHVFYQSAISRRAGVKKGVWEVATGWDRRSAVTSSLLSATWEAYTKSYKVRKYLIRNPIINELGDEPLLRTLVSNRSRQALEILTENVFNVAPMRSG